MKFLLLLALVLGGVWLWRQRGTPAKPPAAPAPESAQPLDMVRCRHCGMHIPGNEAVAGALGSYCSAEHLRLAEPQS